MTVIRLLLALAAVSAPAGLNAHTSDRAAAQPVRSSANRNFPQLLHIGFAAKDARKAADQAIKALGLSPTSLVTDIVFPVHAGRYKGSPADFTVHVCIVETGNTQLEYLQPITGTSPYSDALAGGGDVLPHHMAYIVPSIDDQLARARQLNPNMKVVIDAPVGDSGRYVYVSGVLPGLLVEFVEIGRDN